MFTNRQNKKRPNQDLINNFQETYPDVRPSLDTESSTGREVRVTPSLDDPSLPPTSMRKQNDHDALNATSTVSHNPAGNLPTPSSGMNLLFDETLFDQFTNTSPGAPAFDAYNDAFGGQYPSHIPQNPDPYLKDESFSPEGFRFPGEEDGNTTSLGEVNKQDDHALHTARRVSDSTEVLAVDEREKFRYCVTLHAPTAMIKNQKDIPVTYLNKGQTYVLSVADSVPPPVGSYPARYRTSVRIVFDEAAQKIDPSACWQLWKQVRGSKDAQERGGDVQAVDCLDPAEGEAGQPRNQIQLESMSIDGFCCTWTADIQTGVRECNIGVRFNFLSTDFTHSKGVKGSSVRLCAKTEMIALDVDDAGVDNVSEMCYCKVKLFRDHGAERKLHSDISQTEKSIKKLQRETAMSETGEDDQLGKRKRGSISSFAKSAANHAMTEGEHRRAQIYRNTELHILGDSLTSNLPMTVFAQRAEPTDDPDQFPVRLPGASQSPEKSEGSPQNSDSTTPSNANSTNPSSPATTITEPSRVSSSAAPEQESPNTFKVPPLPAKLSKRSEPPHSGSAVCFYIRFHHDWKRQDHYHRAVYLKERTVRDLKVQICRKQSMNPDSVSRMLHVNPGGLKIIVDDDVVQQLPDGQDMMVEFSRASKPSTSGISEIEIILSF
ncbi:hypothetical protein P170DRAFT_506039 [Aspergillus steynii IBT 23096]|uniref:Grh/CP2 DB domain-containing protein n=1 Tax=Aspergillus steynii IBT 23096 TaxID=1392250 RepID=A0A2I2GRE8_9EURO|nr:uncharacterized protein P170DRAFT_506039 [Aspergillus steynii IBT 23096]PLB55441.1 hypothetical protein P170DRAFT_506039 [Aspergillus steynii IBT 23096]